MSYEVILTPHAERQYSKLPGTVQDSMDAALLRLSDDPRPHTVKKLKGTMLGWRIRVGDYRVLYWVDDKRRIVEVFDIDLRDMVYKNLR